MKLMSWNIQEFDNKKLENLHIQSHIMNNIYPGNEEPPPDIIIFIETMSRAQANRGDISADITCRCMLSHLTSLLRQRSRDWYFVPPVHLAPAHSKQFDDQHDSGWYTISVFFNSEKLCFEGPLLWTERGAMTFYDVVMQDINTANRNNWELFLPEEEVAMNSQSEQGVAFISQRKLCGQTMFSDGNNWINFDGTYHNARVPLLTCFREKQGLQRQITLLACHLLSPITSHGDPLAKKQEKENFAKTTIKNIARIWEIQCEPKPNEIKIVVGDFNCDDIQVDGNPNANAFSPLIYLGFEPHFFHRKMTTSRICPNDSPTTLRNIKEAAPKTDGYLSYWAIDKIFTRYGNNARPSNHNFNPRILNRVEETPGYPIDMKNDLHWHGINSKCQPTDGWIYMPFGNMENYGKIRTTSDHMGIVINF